MFSALLAITLVSGSVEPVQQLEDSRVKVSAIIKNAESPRDHMNAQLLLMKLAKKACGKKAVAVSEGTLSLDNLDAESGKGRQLVISEIYVCQPK